MSSAICAEEQAESKSGEKLDHGIHKLKDTGTDR